MGGLIVSWIPSDIPERNYYTRQIALDPLNQRPRNQCKSALNNLDATLNTLRYLSTCIK